MIEDELARIESEISTYPRILPGIDEPIRRYLLHGGNSAEAFLVQSVRLLQRAATSDDPPLGEVQLSPRVVQGFEAWWKSQGAAEQDELGEEGSAAEMRTSPAPLIFLDAAVREVRVRLSPQVIPADQESSEVYLEVAGDGVVSQVQRYPLRLYRAENGSAETQELEFSLPFPCGAYAFRLDAAGSPIRSWDIKTPAAGRAYIAFSYRSGRLLREPSLPRERIWLLLHEGYSIEPAGSVLSEGGRLPGVWREYFLFELDLADINSLTLLHRKDRRPTTIPIIYGEPPGIEFSGPAPLEGVHLAGLDTYQSSPPLLQVFVGPGVALRHWRLSIQPGSQDYSLRQRQHVRLNEMAGALTLTDDGWAVIDLAHEALLGPDSIGEIQVRLHRAPYADWRRSFCLVGQLQVDFKRAYYLPHPEGDPPAIKAEVLFPQTASLKLDAPGQVIHSDRGRALVRGDPEQDQLRGLLSLRMESGEVAFPLAIDIPKLRWRLMGASDLGLTSWQDVVQEVWLGSPTSELSLVLTAPPCLEGKHLSLAVGGRTTKQLDDFVRKGELQFNLLSLKGVLETGPAVQTIILSVHDVDERIAVEDAPLLRARTRWEAKNIQCAQDLQADQVILTVSWEELGPGTEKELRLWGLTAASSDAPVVSQRIPASLRSSRMVLPATQLRSGEYLLQLAPVDPWAGSLPARPAHDDPSSVIIRIAASGTLRKGETLLLQPRPRRPRPAPRALRPLPYDHLREDPQSPAPSKGRPPACPRHACQ